MSKKLEDDHEKILKFVINSANTLIGSGQIFTKEHDFFDVGGDSLMALHLIDMLQERYNIDLELETLFQQRTFFNIANKVHEKINMKELGG